MHRRQRNRVQWLAVDFEGYGIHRHAIAPVIREVVALGFVEITQEGRAGNAEWRQSNHFRLTYRPTELAEPTDDWRKIETIEVAEMLAHAARQASKKRGSKKHNPSGGKRQKSVRKAHQKPEIPGADSTTLDISGRVPRRPQRVWRDGVQVDAVPVDPTNAYAAVKAGV